MARVACLMLPFVRGVTLPSVLVFFDFLYNLLWPLVVSTDINMKTIQIGLNLFKGLNTTEWGYLCAGMTMAILPMVIVFLCAQKQFISGLQAGAVKG